MRFDKDGNAKTQRAFMAKYGGTVEWDAAPRTMVTERRIDTKDGSVMTKRGFIAKYDGGTREWDRAPDSGAAGAVLQQLMRRKRGDDAVSYTIARQLAGAQSQDDAAPQVV